ncbi:MAG: hypothetical protein PHN16_06360 [Candidatus Omnitrophica bacterium]|nr:hypothetical protein [Candidatus Omnitrophota bacterium]
MKKLLLAVFLVIVPVLAFAGEMQIKSLELEDGGVVKVRAAEGGLINIQIIYESLEDTPEAVKDKIGAGSPGDMARPLPSHLTLIFFDQDGYQLCREVFPLIDFSLDESGDNPKAVLESRSVQCGNGSLDRIDSAEIKYNVF